MCRVILCPVCEKEIARAPSPRRDRVDIADEPCAVCQMELRQEEGRTTPPFRYLELRHPAAVR